MLSDVEESLPVLCQLTSLQHLDLSQCTESRGQVGCHLHSLLYCGLQFREPTLFLRQLAASLPALQSLDISGTNLAGSGAERQSGQFIATENIFSWIQHFYFPRL